MSRAPSRSRPSIGLFGGTFDPVHYGHLRAAQEAREMLALDDFRLLPAGTPPHRPAPVASADQRLAMLRLAISGRAGFSIDDREMRRDGPSFMVDTLSEIRAETGDSRLLLMIGQDAANALDTWHEWRMIFSLAHLVIMHRPDSLPAWSGELEHQMQRRFVQDPGRLSSEPAGLVFSLEVTQLAISATGIRGLIGAGHSPRFLLPDPVIDYIEQKQLYFAGAARKG